MDRQSAAFRDQTTDAMAAPDGPMPCKGWCGESYMVDHFREKGQLDLDPDVPPLCEACVEIDRRRNENEELPV